MSEVSVEQEDWSELIRMLKDVEDAIPSLNGGNDADGVYRSSHQALQGFHTTAAMLGLADLESVGLELERCLTQKIKDSKDAEMVSLFAFAVNALMDAMKKAEPGSEASSVQPKEVLDILARDGAFDLALMDVRMPVMGGLEAAARIRLLPPPVCALPLVAVTAHAMSGDRERVLAAGMSGYIAKPVNFADLASMLDRFKAKSVSNR